MLRIRFKTILIFFTITLFSLVTLGVALSDWLKLDFDKDMSEKLEAKKILRPVEIYTQGAGFTLGQQINTTPEALSVYFNHEWRKREWNEVLLPGDFLVANATQCHEKWQIQNLSDDTQCLAWVSKNSSAGNINILIVNSQGNIEKIFQGTNSVDSLQFSHKLYAQFIGDDPILQKQFQLSDINPLCPQAIMAIEDSSFFEHDGYSLRSITRAFVKNISTGRSSQGGSTITQQLVKNYFLTPEKTIERKLKEFAMAVWLESKFSKDQIIETYMNIIYMGQSGPFQVRGYGAAAQYYFNKSIKSLNLGDCALLAAIINSPGMYNPFRNQERALQRKELVLKKMLEQQMITQEQMTSALTQPLPQKPQSLASDTAPYFLNSVKRQIKDLGYEWQDLKIYTALNLHSQQKGQSAILDHLKSLEGQKYFSDLKSKGKLLEAVLISADNKTGLIHTAIGGRSFKITQFNRILDAHRQPGSTIKPFVFLSALENGISDTTILKDEKLTLKSGKQSWSPENYDKKFHGDVPLSDALKFSYNISTVALGEQVGLSEVISTLKTAGINSPIPEVPSIYLGSFEVFPNELLNAYLVLASYGKNIKSSFIEKILNRDEVEIFRHQNTEEPLFAEDNAKKILLILNEATLSGTASAIGRAQLNRPVAGKTGTTSDYKDAWFVGTDGVNTTLVWVGYDDNTRTKLTGSSGAIPIWIRYHQ